MLRRLGFSLSSIILIATTAYPQKLATPVVGGYRVPDGLMLRMLKAEDSRDAAPVIEMLADVNPAVRYRAALAAGRIGDDAAVAKLASLLNDSSFEVRAMAAFALGEIESIQATDAILTALGDRRTRDAVRARLVEAAGKIAAANAPAANAAATAAKDPKLAALGDAILDALEAEDARREKQSRDTILAGLTAVLRARPEGGDETASIFLTNLDARVRADAANALARLRAKNANLALRAMLMSDDDPIARANAARALGAADDKEALNILIEAATGDDDSRVRVSAIRALAAVRDAKAADSLLDHAEKLLGAYTKARKPNLIPTEQNEFIEVAATLGRLLANTYNQRADDLIRDFGKMDQGQSTEVYIARVRIGQRRGNPNERPELNHWRQYSTLAQLAGEFAAIEPISDVGKEMKKEAPDILRPLAKAYAEADPVKEGKSMMAAPDVIRAFARFKTDDLAEILRTAMENEDVQTRATAAILLGELPPSPENAGALKRAVMRGMRDHRDNDALLAAIDAVYKSDKKAAADVLLIALAAPDYLIRRNVLAKLADKEIAAATPEVVSRLAAAKDKRLDKVLPYDAKTGTRLGQVLNGDADYRRALSRKNGSVRAVLRTQKGTFTIDLLPEDAPLTVDNFVKLARSGYFNGLEVHRVVPNFVMQDGDPRGDGNGGPGWSIRCEINMVPYERGIVGMALSGKDTGGSQWFVTHSPQPHLDGGYTVFGKVNEKDMKVVDKIVRGDKILSVIIVEGSLPQRAQRSPRKTR